MSITVSEQTLSSIAHYLSPLSDEEQQQQQKELTSLVSQLAQKILEDLQNGAKAEIEFKHLKGHTTDFDLIVRWVACELSEQQDFRVKHHTEKRSSGLRWVKDKPRPPKTSTFEVFEKQ